MKPIMLSEQDVLTKMNRKKLLENLSKAFSGLAKETSVQPTQSVTIFPDGLGDCIYYPGLVNDLGVFGVAVSPFFTNLIDSDTSPVKPHTILFDSTTGDLLLIAESLTLTAMRTAGTTALAVSKLVSSDDKNLAIVGAGQLAIEHAHFAKLIHQWNSIEIVSPSVVDKKSSKHSERLEEIKKVNGVSPGLSIESSVRNADVVMLCTSSAVPVVESAWLKPTQIVASISTDGENAHEIPPDLLTNFAVYCDYKKTTPKIAGEMVLASNKGIWDEKLIVADLPELISIEGQQSQRPAYFRTVGLGIEDIAAGKTLLDGF